jgi:hypothetical protein
MHEIPLRSIETRTLHIYHSSKRMVNSDVKGDNLTIESDDGSTRMNVTPKFEPVQGNISIFRKRTRVGQHLMYDESVLLAETAQDFHSTREDLDGLRTSRTDASWNPYTSSCVNIRIRHNMMNR